MQFAASASLEKIFAQHTTYYLRIKNEETVSLSSTMPDSYIRWLSLLFKLNGKVTKILYIKMSLKNPCYLVDNMGNNLS